MEQREELKLIEEVKKGDRLAFARLVDAHKKQVYNLAFTFVKSREEAEEIAQDVFVQVFRKLNYFRGESKFSVWVYRIAYNTSLNKLRKLKNKPVGQSLNEDFVGSATDTESLLNSLKLQEQKHYIAKALAQLSEQDQAIVRLYYLEELKVREIEEVTGLRASNIKVRLLRSREKLHLCLNKLLKTEARTLL